MVDNFLENDYTYFFECINWINKNLKNAKKNKPKNKYEKLKYDEKGNLLNFNQMYLKRNANEIIFSKVTLGCLENAIVLKHLLEKRNYDSKIISKFKMKTFSGLFWNHAVCLVKLNKKIIFIDPTFAYISNYSDERIFKNEYKINLPLNEMSSLDDYHCYILKKIIHKYKNFKFDFDSNLSIGFDKDFLVIVKKILDLKPFKNYDTFEIYERILILKKILDSNDVNNKILTYGYCIDSNLEFQVMHFLEINEKVIDIINLKCYDKNLIEKIWVGEKNIVYKYLENNTLFENASDLIDFYLSRLGIKNCKCGFK
ncbi:MAG: hypothetical protein PHT94_01115 [Candidatus Nanoarchaeia archaeon]|nr:hypothetical protein [Candidatus Nanoarchaeia archaeon]